ncbi:MAG: secretin N-terminal domain-containing protein [Candidatus Omnitrophota bacterium]
MGDNIREAIKRVPTIILVIMFIASPSPIAQSLAEDASAEQKTALPAGSGSEPAKAQDIPEQAQAETAGAVSAAASQAQAPEEALSAAALSEGVPVEPGNVTVNFKGADINTVLAYISEVAGVDIVSAPDVKGIVDLRLTNKPWKAALDIIVRNYGFAYEREGDIIRVVTLDKLKQEELATQAFSLNYSKSKDVVAALKNIVGERGNVVFDDRTNTVLVTDIPTNLYRIGQLIERLDKRTEQVLIEARVIETILGDDEKLGIDWTAKITAAGARRPITFPFDYYDAGPLLEKYTPLVQTGGTTTVYDALGNPLTTKTGTFPSGKSGPSGGATPVDANDKGFPFVDYTVDTMKNAFAFGTLDFTEFKAVLEMLKSRSDTDTISNPRIATLNNNKATINVGDIIYIPRFERNSTTGKMEITGYDQTNSGVVLDVTPHINDIGEIAMDIVPQIKQYLGTAPIAPDSDIFAPQFNTREAKTQVIVRDGQTIFIGGLISEREIDKRTKLPFIGDLLEDIPGIGLLFSHKNIVKERVELIFFITVHIMSPGREIKGVPLPDKAQAPAFVETQRGDMAGKKKLKRKY